MNHKVIRYLWSPAIALLPVLFSTGCYLPQQKHIVEPAFYYWKSQVSLNNQEQGTMQMTARKLYVKFFDVAWNVPQKSAMPVAKAQFSDSTKTFITSQQIQVIPTVFITNESMILLDSSKIIPLAENIASLIGSIGTSQLPNTNFQEIQLDCDWTAGTRDKYFMLLEHLKKQPVFKGKILSATIRLYQCKYRHKTGIPPVDRGLLMCYNMGNLKNPLTKNSILDPVDLEQYTANLDQYPLDLDIAFPIFNWKVLFRKNNYAGLIQNLPTENLEKKLLTNREGNTFRLLKDTVLLGYDLYKDDLIRQEDSNFEDILRSARILKSKIRNEKLTMSLFHLDSSTLNNYSTHEIQTIFLSLH